MKAKKTAKAARKIEAGLSQYAIAFAKGKIQAIRTLLLETTGGHLPDEVRQELKSAYYAVNRASNAFDPRSKEKD